MTCWSAATTTASPVLDDGAPGAALTRSRGPCASGQAGSAARLNPARDSGLGADPVPVEVRRSRAGRGRWCARPVLCARPVPVRRVARKVGSSALAPSLHPTRATPRSASARRATALAWRGPARAPAPCAARAADPPGAGVPGSQGPAQRVALDGGVGVVVTEQVDRPGSARAVRAVGQGATAVQRPGGEVAVAGCGQHVIGVEQGHDAPGDDGGAFPVLHRNGRPVNLSEVRGRAVDPARTATVGGGSMLNREKEIVPAAGERAKGASAAGPPPGHRGRPSPCWVDEVAAGVVGVPLEAGPPRR